MVSRWLLLRTTLMDVSVWLRGLGLERYTPAFRDNDIDAEILAELTADDLIGLGVTSIGHRRGSGRQRSVVSTDFEWLHGVETRHSAERQMSLKPAVASR